MQCIGKGAHKGKHDEVCIQAIQAVALVGGVVGRPLLMANVFHDLVLTLTRNIMPCATHMLSFGNVVFVNFL